MEVPNIKKMHFFYIFFCLHDKRLGEARLLPLLGARCYLKPTFAKASVGTPCSTSLGWRKPPEAQRAKGGSPFLYFFSSFLHLFYHKRQKPSIHTVFWAKVF